jgi:hypothetical protein
VHVKEYRSDRYVGEGDELFFGFILHARWALKILKYNLCVTI